MTDRMKDTLALLDVLDLSASLSLYPDGRVELFVHTEPKSLDKSLDPLLRSLNQAVELAKYYARRRRDDDDEGGTRVRPKSPVLTG